MAKVKVFAIRLMAPSHWDATDSHHRRPQVRAVVATTSRVKAVEAFNAAGSNITVGYLADMGGVTGNHKEVEAAMSKPGTVFHATSDSYGAPYVEANPKPPRGS